MIFFTSNPNLKKLFFAVFIFPGGRGGTRVSDFFSKE